MNFREKITTDILIGVKSFTEQESALIVYHNTFNELPNVLDVLIENYSGAFNFIIKNTL